MNNTQKKSKRVQINFACTTKELAAAKLMATRMGMTLSGFMRFLIKREANKGGIRRLEEEGNE